MTSSPRHCTALVHCRPTTASTSSFLTVLMKRKKKKARSHSLPVYHPQISRRLHGGKCVKDSSALAEGRAPRRWIGAGERITSQQSDFQLLERKLRRRPFFEVSTDPLQIRTSGRKAFKKCNKSIMRWALWLPIERIARWSSSPSIILSNLITPEMPDNNPPSWLPQNENYTPVWRPALTATWLCSCSDQLHLLFKGSLVVYYLNRNNLPKSMWTNEPTLVQLTSSKDHQHFSPHTQAGDQWCDGRTVMLCIERKFSTKNFR